MSISLIIAFLSSFFQYVDVAYRFLPWSLFYTYTFPLKHIVFFNSRLSISVLTKTFWYPPNYLYGPILHCKSNRIIAHEMRANFKDGLVVQVD